MTRQLLAHRDPALTRKTRKSEAGARINTNCLPVAGPCNFSRNLQKFSATRGFRVTHKPRFVGCANETKSSGSSAVRGGLGSGRRSNAHQSVLQRESIVLVEAVLSACQESGVSGHLGGEIPLGSKSFMSSFKVPFHNAKQTILYSLLIVLQFRLGCALQYPLNCI